MEKSNYILELSKDTVTKGGEGRLLCRPGGQKGEEDGT